MGDVVLFPALPGDRRLTPAREDVAAAHLREQVEAPRYVDPRRMTVRAGTVALRRVPDPNGAIDTTLLYGEAVNVFDIAEGWAWGQAVADGYVGYMPAATLADAGEPATHRVAVPLTHAYPVADVKREPVGGLFLNSQVRSLGESGRMTLLDGGMFVPTRHLMPLDVHEPDFVAVAERFLHVPYLWGGNSAQGIDCSGLIQVAVRATGLPCPRDSDMQEAALGAQVEIDAPRRRGDIIFWKGHVGTMLDEARLLHANQHAMQVSEEPLRDAEARIAQDQGLAVTSVRRLFPD